MKRKLLVLTALLGISLTPSLGGAALPYPACNVFCPGKSSGTPCLCPVGTDRPGHQTTCGKWNQVGGCWYE
jgi:hypothetical protein